MIYNISKVFIFFNYFGIVTLDVHRHKFVRGHAVVYNHLKMVYLMNVSSDIFFIRNKTYYYWCKLSITGGEIKLRVPLNTNYSSITVKRLVQNCKMISVQILWTTVCAQQILNCLGVHDHKQHHYKVSSRWYRTKITSAQEINLWKIVFPLWGFDHFAFHIDLAIKCELNIHIHYPTYNIITKQHVA